MFQKTFTAVLLSASGKKHTHLSDERTFAFWAGSQSLIPSSLFSVFISTTPPVFFLSFFSQ